MMQEIPLRAGRSSFCVLSGPNMAAIFGSFLTQFNRSWMSSFLSSSRRWETVGGSAMYFNDVMKWRPYTLRRGFCHARNFTWNRSRKLKYRLIQRSYFTSNSKLAFRIPIHSFLNIYFISVRTTRERGQIVQNKFFQILVHSFGIDGNTIRSSYHCQCQVAILPIFSGKSMNPK